MADSSLDFEIHPSSGAPIYRQIMDQVKALVASRRLVPGQMLPSIRQLATDLEVNMMTVSKAYARQAVEWYKHLYAFRERVEPRQYYCIDYRELIRNPRETVEKLYEHFGWSMSEGYRTRLEAATERQREFKSKHEYTLEEFGLTKEWIQQELGEVMETYHLER